MNLARVRPNAGEILMEYTAATSNCPIDTPIRLGQSAHPCRTNEPTFLGTEMKRDLHQHMNPRASGLGGTFASCAILALEDRFVSGRMTMA
jgi:hypothetical protein